MKKVADATAGKTRSEQMLETIAAGDAVLIKHFGKPVYTIEVNTGVSQNRQHTKKRVSSMQQMLSYGLPVAELKLLFKTIRRAGCPYKRNNLKTDYKVVGIIQMIYRYKIRNNNVMGPDKNKFF
jgi:hypothetical protein